nr:hypothetical protein [Tanacetum cinerariifolium]
MKNRQDTAHLAVTLGLGLPEDQWPRIRSDLVGELEARHRQYTYVFGTIGYEKIYSTVKFVERWMEVPNTGLVIASAYNKVVVNLSDVGGCNTSFPLWSRPPQSDSHEIIVVAHVDGNHYIIVVLRKGALLRDVYQGEFGIRPKTTLKIRTANDDVRLQALIDGKKVVITEASIRHDLKLNNTKGKSCLPNAMNFEKLARMGAKTTSWNEFSSTMASAIICLANNQKLNFSKYILDNLKKNLEASVPFYMFHRRKEKNERKETKVSHIELPTEDPVPTPSNDPLPSGEDSMPLKELMVLCTNLSNKVLDLENEVIEMKSSHKAKIVELESRVEKLKEEENKSLTKELKSFNSKVDTPAYKETIKDKEKSSKHGRKIIDIDADAEVNL